MHHLGLLGREDPLVDGGSYNETDFLGNFLNFIDKELEKQSLQDQAKVAKVAPLKEFPASTISHPDSGALMIVDSAACELAVSYAPAMLEASHETPASLNYDSWPLFAEPTRTWSRAATT